MIFTSDLSMEQRYKITPQFILVSAVAVFLSFLIHEFAHFITGVALGNDMAMNLNSSYPTSGEFIEPWHEHLVSAAGPLITLLQAVIVFLVVRRRNIPMLFPFLLTPLIMRFMALLLTFRNLNDEARLSHDAGLSVWTLPVLMCALLFYLVFRIVRRYEYDRRFVLLGLLVVTIWSIVLILGNQLFLA